MNISICTAVVLFCVTIAQGYKCLFNVPVTPVILKCGKDVYRTDLDHVNAVNYCGQNRNGTEITDQDVRCILEKLKYIKGGKVAPNVIIDSIQEIFPGHWGTLTSSVFQCAQESLKKSDQTDKFKHVNCRMNAYKDVCGHKTCDWINSFD